MTKGEEGKKGRRMTAGHINERIRNGYMWKEGRR
jgi:hypothetical protein